MKNKKAGEGISSSPAFLFSIVFVLFYFFIFLKSNSFHVADGFFEVPIIFDTLAESFPLFC